MQSTNRLAYKLVCFAAVLALIVVMLGAYTRLKDAGLGCPDWPGCYGHMVAPTTPAGVLHATTAFPGEAVNEMKAWTEMTHRYVAGTLGLLIFISALLIISRRKLANQPIGLALGLMALVVFQALLGMWTVTLRLLPTVVMLHLLGGMTILTLLWLLVLRLGEFFQTKTHYSARVFRPWAVIGLIIVIAQIILGGWTSANYAALACPDFPYCQGKLLPPLDFQSAYQFWMAIGPNFQGGVLNNIARVTIHMTHRFGGLITFIYISWLAIWLLVASKSEILQRIAVIMLVVLVTQVMLGIANVVWLLPLPIAVAHNGVAALLLLSVVTLNYALYVLVKNKSALK